MNEKDKKSSTSPTSDIVQTSTQGGEINLSPSGPGLETIKDGNKKEWRIMREGYKLQPGEVVSYHVKLKRQVVTGGKHVNA